MSEMVKTNVQNVGMAEAKKEDDAAVGPLVETYGVKYECAVGKRRGRIATRCCSSVTPRLSIERYTYHDSDRERIFARSANAHEKPRAV